MIPGSLHFTEREALGAIFNQGAESFRDNSEAITRTAKTMVSRYSVKTLKALERARAAAAITNSTSKFGDVFENVECYTQDARRFLNEAKDELAVLSIGYGIRIARLAEIRRSVRFEW